MGGQAPYAINAGLSYEIRETQTSISLSYNVQGEQLTVIASGRNPDVYTAPFHSLNFNAYHSFGKKRNSRLTISVENMLDDDRLLVYRSFGAKNQIYTRFKPGNHSHAIERAVYPRVHLHRISNQPFPHHHHEKSESFCRSRNVNHVLPRVLRKHF